MNLKSFLRSGLLVAVFTFPFEIGAAEPVKVPLKDSAGKSVGMANLTQLKHGVKVEIDVKNMKPGEHAIHFHEKGNCNTPGFKSAGEHFSPEHKQHGFDKAQGPHAGDMPNLVVNSDGTAHSEMINTEVTLEKKGSNSLEKQGGTSLVIHSGPDDYESQPAGDSGDRIACGEIRATS